MSTNEPSTHWPPSDDDPVAVAEEAPYVAPHRELRIGYGDGLVQHPAPRGADPEARPRRRLRAIRRFILFVLLVGLAWSAWAAAAFYDLTVGLHDADPIALERRIDWSSVRRALRDDLQAGPIAPSGDQTVDALVSERGIANLLRTVKLDDHGWDTAEPPADEAAPDFEWYRIRYAFFSGSPFVFRVDIRPDSATPRQPMVLLFRWTGDWRLVRVFLPRNTETAAGTAPDSPPATGPTSAAEPSASLGAEHVTLYEEDPKNAQGKLLKGSVTWRTEQLPPIAGGVSGLAVVAHITVPERSMSATIAIRRNLDRSLPASHMIEVSFELPANSTMQGVQEMVGIMMKPNEEAPGQNLAGTRVKVRDGFFLFALSAIDLDVQHNMEVLKDRPWLGIPFRYGNGSRAVLVIEKGAAGDRSLAEGLAQWAATAATGTNPGKN